MSGTGLENPKILRIAEDKLKEAALDWYVSPVADDEVTARLYDAAADYAYVVYGELGDDGVEAERKSRGAADE